MIAHSLAETLIFLESRSHTDAEKEYLCSIRQMIVEHAAMRETLEQICDLTDSSYIRALSQSTLQQSDFKTDPVEETSARQIMDVLSDALPSEEQLKALNKAAEMVRFRKRGIF